MIHRSLPLDVEVERHVCDYHRRFPNDRSYPGCTCSRTYRGVRRERDRSDDVIHEGEPEHPAD